MSLSRPSAESFDTVWRRVEHTLAGAPLTFHAWSLGFRKVFFSKGVRGFSMSIHQTVKFQDALDIVESLPEEQQKTLIDIIRRRLIEHRRDVLAEHIKEAGSGSTDGVW
jgi:hypothetical protein